MSTDENPEIGLEIPQHILGLGEKLDRQGLLVPLTVEETNTLERIGLRVILSRFRLWKNSRLPVNRIPQEILISIVADVTAADPTGYAALIRLTHVCTQWRQVISACPTFWTNIRFGGGRASGSLAKVFFERAGECEMDVDVSFALVMRRGRMSLSPQKNMLVLPNLSPGQKIRALSVGSHTWGGIRKLIGGWAHALSPLQELVLCTEEERHNPFTPMNFSGEALKTLTLTGFVFPGLQEIKAPNLTVLELRVSYEDYLSVTMLFDFLDATPSLEQVWISSSLVCQFPPPDRKVDLLRLRSISLAMKHVAQVASQLICPSVMDTQLADVLPEENDVSVFPLELRLLLATYSVEAITEVLMHVSDRDELRQGSLHFRSPSGTTFKITCAMDFLPEPYPSFADEIWPFPILFDQTVATMLSLNLGEVVSLTIDLQNSSDPAVDSGHVKAGLAAAFEQCLDLREVVLENYNPGRFPDFSREKMPPIRALRIKHPEDVPWEELVEDVIEAARSRHSRGAPLEQIEIFTVEEQPRIQQLESLVEEVVYRGANS